MLAEIEEKLIGLLKGKMQDLPEGSVSAGGKPGRPPYVLLGNRSFTFERVDIAESVDRVVVDVEEQLSCGEGTCRLTEQATPRDRRHRGADRHPAQGEPGLYGGLRRRDRQLCGRCRIGEGEGQGKVLDGGDVFG